MTSTSFEDEIFSKLEDEGILPRGQRATMPSLAEWSEAFLDCADDIIKTGINQLMGVTGRKRHKTSIEHVARFSENADRLGWTQKTLVRAVRFELQGPVNGSENELDDRKVLSYFEEASKMLCMFRSEPDPERVRSQASAAGNLNRHPGHNLSVEESETQQKYGLTVGYKDPDGHTHSTVRTPKANKPILASYLDIIAKLPAAKTTPFVQEAAVAIPA